jgi:hypothetical protein
MLKRISGAMETPARLWCRAMHPDPMWPIHGCYRCPSCLRTYPVPWELPETPITPAMKEIRVTGLRPEFTPLVETN